MATKRKDGRWCETFTINGKKYFAYGSTRKEAIEKAADKKTLLQSKLNIKGVEMTLNQYHSKWVDARQGTVRGATLRRQQFDYKRCSEAVIDAAGTTFGDLKIVDIEVQHIRDLQKTLQATENKNGSQRYSNDTINASIDVIKHILNDAIKERIINFNPCTAIKPLKRTIKPARETTHRALSIKETRAFLDAAASSYYLNVYKFMLYSGCRCGEVGALRLTDIDRKGGKLKIRRTLTKDENGVYIIGDSAKTNFGVRDIPLTEELLDTIKAQLEINKLLLPEKVTNIDALIFMSPEGNLLSDTCVNRDITRKCKAAGIDKFTAHALRDTFATRCIESGMNPKTLQEILGHSDIGITMNLYCHVMDETKVNEMKLVKIGI